MKQSDFVFDLALGEALKKMGMERAETANEDVLELGRAICVQAAKHRIDRCATADDAARGFRALGLPTNSLGPAAGALFREKKWWFTGTWEKSKRISNHARMNRVWKLTGD